MLLYCLRWCFVLGVTLGVAHEGDSPWVVILNTSRYWFNYRHAANAVAVFQLAADLGVPRERLLLFNAFDIANDYRNPDPGTVRYSGVTDETWDYDGVEADYVDSEVSAESFLALLTGRAARATVGKKQLNSNSNSAVLIYMAGHGGDEFFKFHDSEELSAQDLAAALQEMHAKGRYGQMLLILDTCQASTMANYITAPNVVTLASSAKGENSYAFQTEDSLGVSIIDRFTHSLSEFMRRNMRYKGGQQTLPKSLSLHDLYTSFQPHILHSTATVIGSSGEAVNMKKIKLHRYFGGGGNSPSAGGLHPEEANGDWVQLQPSGWEASTPQSRRAAVEELLGIS